MTLFRPPQLCRRRARIFPPFLVGRTLRCCCDVRIDPCPEPQLKGLLDAAIFATVEAEDDYATAGFQGAGQVGEELVKHSTLVVHGNTQRLEAALKRPAGLRRSSVETGCRQNAPDKVGEL